MDIPTEQLPRLAPFARAKKPTPSQAASLLASTHPHHRGDGEADDGSPLPTLCRYRDLVKAGVCSNRMQLGRMIANEGMPPGFKLSANIHVWNVAELLCWLRAKQSQG